jgi:hypothetical protein
MVPVVHKRQDAMQDTFSHHRVEGIASLGS